MKKTKRIKDAASGVLARWKHRRADDGTASRIQGIGESKTRAGRSQKSNTSVAPIDLSSGAPALETPAYLSQPAIEAIELGHNQYSHPWGDEQLRRAIAALASRSPRMRGRVIDPDTEVTITCGTSAAVAAVLMAVVDPGCEVIVFEPFFEGYEAAIRLAGGVPRFVPLSPPYWHISKRELAKYFNKRTCAVIINTPHNPSGHALSPYELKAVGDLCDKWNAVLISDEIYSQLAYDEAGHFSALGNANHRDKTIVIDGMSKAYNVSGWRVGHVIAPPKLTKAFRIVQSTMGLMAPTPFQVAARHALTSTTVRSQMQATVEHYRDVRDVLCAALVAQGFKLSVPQGGTFVFADASDVFGPDVTDEQARDALLEVTGVLAGPGSWFFRAESPDGKRPWLRFCFARDKETVERAAEALKLLSSRS